MRERERIFTVTSSTQIYIHAYIHMILYAIHINLNLVLMFILRLLCTVQILDNLYFDALFGNIVVKTFMQVKPFECN